MSVPGADPIAHPAPLPSHDVDLVVERRYSSTVVVDRVAAPVNAGAQDVGGAPPRASRRAPPSSTMSVCPGGGHCSNTNALEGDGVEAQAAGGASTRAYGLQATKLHRERLAGDVVAATLMHGRRWIP
jgi:hypothetical protein